MQIIYLPLLLECNRFFTRPMEKPRIAEPLARPPLGQAGRSHATACVPLRSANRRCVEGRNRVHSRNRETGERTALPPEPGPKPVTRGHGCPRPKLLIHPPGTE